MTIEKTYPFPFLKDNAHLFVLENGHTIVTIRKPGEITNISTWVKTGSINENDLNNGVSHFLEHLMFKGTERLNPGDFDRILESRGGIINAATWKDYTYYYVTIPRGDKDENFKLAIDLHADMMLNATLPDEEIGPTYDINNPTVTEKRERSVVIEEISMREDQPWTKTYNTLNDIMYKQHPYKRDTIGTRNIIASIPREKIYEYYKTWYVPQNMITIVVSDNQNDEMLQLVQKHFVFKDLKEGPANTYEPEQPTKEAVMRNITGDVTTGFGMMGFHGPKPSNLKDVMAIDATSIIMGEGRSSRLIQNLIEKPKNPIFNTVNFTHYHFKDGNNILIQTNFKADKKDEAIEVLLDEVSSLQENPITQEEFNKAKKKLEARFAETTETVSGIAESVGYSIILTNNIETYTKYLDNLKGLTLEDLKDCIDKYLNIQNVYVATMTPQ